MTCDDVTHARAKRALNHFRPRPYQRAATNQLYWPAPSLPMSEQEVDALCRAGFAKRFAYSVNQFCVELTARGVLERDGEI